jgi:hypothetical protein
MSLEETMLAIGCPAELHNDAVQLPLAEVPDGPLYFPAALLGVDDELVVPPVEMIDLTQD